MRAHYWAVDPQWAERSALVIKRLKLSTLRVGYATQASLPHTSYPTPCCASYMHLLTALRASIVQIYPRLKFCNAVNICLLAGTAVLSVRRLFLIQTLCATLHLSVERP